MPNGLKDKMAHLIIQVRGFNRDFLISLLKNKLVKLCKLKLLTDIIQGTYLII